QGLSPATVKPNLQARSRPTTFPRPLSETRETRWGDETPLAGPRGVRMIAPPSRGPARATRACGRPFREESRTIMPSTARSFPVPPAALLLLAAPLGCHSDAPGPPASGAGGGAAVTRSAPTRPGSASASAQAVGQDGPEQ